MVVRIGFCLVECDVYMRVTSTVYMGWILGSGM